MKWIDFLRVEVGGVVEAKRLTECGPGGDLREVGPAAVEIEETCVAEPLNWLADSGKVVALKLHRHKLGDATVLSSKKPG